MTKKRVWCLYRVSGKSQVSIDDDIPVQRKSCLDFVNNKANWEVTKELYEKGVSGWSKKAKDRNQLNIIKEGAINKEFDILLLFIADRLGRREDETPLVVQFLIEQGVEVWSVQEGQIKIEQHSDILMNYIRFWQSSGESKKTSIRIREGKKQTSALGYYQGGTVPYGYKVVETDQPHWKNKDKKMKEYVINEEEAELIRLIYHLYVEKRMGSLKMLDYINSNGYRTRRGKLFIKNSILTIIKNPIYIGKKRYAAFDGKKGDTQPYNEKLRIISDDVFNKAQQILEERKKEYKKQDKSGISLDGKLMFSGLVFCKYCGKKLIANYRNQKTKNKKTGEIVTRTLYRYICGMYTGRHQYEQTLWSANKYDPIIIEEIKQVFTLLDMKQIIATTVNQKKKQNIQKEKSLKVLKKKIDGYKIQLNKLNSEIVGSLMGESKYTAEELSGAINRMEEKIQQATKTFNDVSEEIKNEREDYFRLDYIANELEGWKYKFDNAENELKKVMLSRVIDKVYLGKGEIKVEFKLSIQECLEEFYNK